MNRSQFLNPIVPMQEGTMGDYILFAHTNLLEI
jgi:hypothetical protein